MEQIGYVSFAINLLLGGFMYLLKTSYEEVKQKQHQLETKQEEANKEISKIREEYIKREDFKEFKEELWKKLDKLELDLRERIPRISDE